MDPHQPSLPREPQHGIPAEWPMVVMLLPMFVFGLATFYKRGVQTINDLIDGSLTIFSFLMLFSIPCLISISVVCGLYCLTQRLVFGKAYLQLETDQPFTDGFIRARILLKTLRVPRDGFTLYIRYSEDGVDAQETFWKEKLYHLRGDPVSLGNEMMTLVPWQVELPEKMHNTEVPTKGRILHIGIRARFPLISMHHQFSVRSQPSWSLLDEIKKLMHKSS
jgi:hypothetical protein